MSKTIKEIAYQKYQLDWMMKHNLSLWDLIKEMEKVQFEGEEDDNGYYVTTERREEYEWAISSLDIFAAWERDFGFNGSLWVCFEEFLSAEYLDEPYMEELLNDSEYNLWLKDVESNMNLQEKQSLYDRLCRALADYDDPIGADRGYEMTNDDWLYEFYDVMNDICIHWNDLGFEGN